MRRFFAIDVVVMGVLLVIGACGSYFISRKLPLDAMLQYGSVWFQADVDRVYHNMTERDSNHYRTKVHPLSSLAMNPPTYVLRKSGVDAEMAVRIVCAVAAGVWLATLFLLLRCIDLPRLDATVFALVAAASAASLFWCAVPETYVLSSLSILVVMVFVALAETRSFSARSYVVVSAISLSMTVTNWMIGVLATMVHHTPRRAFRITADAFLVVTILWAMQNVVFPTTRFFLFPFGERKYLFLDAAGSLLDRLIVFFGYVVVMPDAQVVRNPLGPSWPLLTVQLSHLGSLSALGAAAICLWALLLLYGVWVFFRVGGRKKFKQVLAFTLLGQLALHMVYGEEVFLYSLHWMPLLILFAAMGADSPGRVWVLLAAAALAVLAGVNNVRQFERAATEIRSAVVEEAPVGAGGDRGQAATIKRAEIREGGQ